MVMIALRFMLWNAFRMLRLRLRACFTVMSLISLAMIVVGMISLPFGRGGDTALWGQLAVIALSVLFFLFWTGVSYFYDTMIFRQTPED